jgi:hypothetical protein
MNAVNLTKLSDVRVLAGSDVVDSGPLPAFSDEACSFLDDLSKALLKDPRTRRLSDVVSFAYWCRKGNVQREKQKREGSIENRLGRGFAFHIAPSNVPVNFAFSYVFSLLAGNATLVRCPSKAFEQVEVVLDGLRKAFEAHPEIERRSALVTYPAAGDTTAFLSNVSDVRVIWGGDATVAKVRAMPSKPRCVDVAFSDRYSIALFDAVAVSALDDSSLGELAKNFYNDTYLMDQNACSSPQTILWVGSDAEIKAAKKLFWGAVEAEAARRYDLQAAVAVDKYVQLCGDIMRGTVESGSTGSGMLATVEIFDGCKLSTELRGVGGYFYEKTVAGLADVADSIDEKYQTLVQFGFNAEELARFIVDSRISGIDRIVDPGKAMDIGLVWDGMDLIDSMSRIVALA